MHNKKSIQNLLMRRHNLSREEMEKALLIYIKKNNYFDHSDDSKTCVNIGLFYAFIDPEGFEEVIR